MVCFLPQSFRVSLCQPVIADFWPLELRESISVILNHQVGSNLLQQLRKLRKRPVQTLDKMVWLTGTSWALVMWSQMPRQRVREDWTVPGRKTSPHLAGSNMGRGVPISDVHRASPELSPDTVCPQVAPLLICWDKNLPPSTRHSRWKPPRTAAALSLPHLAPSCFQPAQSHYLPVLG